MTTRAGKFLGFINAEEATTTIELALISFPLFLLLLGTVEGGRMLWTENSLQYAVERTARCAVVSTSTCGTTAQIQSYAQSMLSGMSVSASTFSSTTASCGVQVSASLPYTPLLPLPMTVTLTASSCRPNS